MSYHCQTDIAVADEILKAVFHFAQKYQNPVKFAAARTIPIKVQHHRINFINLRKFFPVLPLHVLNS